MASGPVRVARQGLLHVSEAGGVTLGLLVVFPVLPNREHSVGQPSCPDSHRTICISKCRRLNIVRRKYAGVHGCSLNTQDMSPVRPRGGVPAGSRATSDLVFR